MKDFNMGGHSKRSCSVSKISPPLPIPPLTPPTATRIQDEDFIVITMNFPYEMNLAVIPDRSQITVYNNGIPYVGEKVTIRAPQDKFIIEADIWPTAMGVVRLVVTPDPIPFTTLEERVYDYTIDILPTAP